MDHDFEYVRFRQQVQIGPQRRRLGIHLDQPAALTLLRDEIALHREYVAWRHRTGRPVTTWPEAGLVASPFVVEFVEA